jgi:hypothetical protein
MKVSWAKEELLQYLMKNDDQIFAINQSRYILLIICRSAVSLFGKFRLLCSIVIQAQVSY